MTDHLYVHVPFCNTICSYCDFCHRVYDSNTVTKWLSTIKEEIAEKLDNQYKTIYIGGGTPSALSVFELDTLLSFIQPYTSEVEEFTIEVNPESLTLDKIEVFKKYGINRISIGVQSTDDNLLRILNRHHSFEDVKNKIILLKDNGIDNISIDLMYSLPFQTMEILDKTIDDVLTLDIKHISIYSLTIEDHTVFKSKGYDHLDEDTEADMYDNIVDRLNREGYRQYEISNFSKDGYQSKHNMAYWRYNDFIGISLGASSKLGSHRYTNTFRFNEYFDDYHNLSEDLQLSKKDLMFENIMMSLRTVYGLDIDEFNRRYDTDFLNIYKDVLVKNSNNLSVDNNHLICKNLAILNNILLDFMD